MKLYVLLLIGCCAAKAAAPAFRAEKTTDHGIAVIRLSDVRRGVVVSMVPSVGNRAYELTVHGKNLLYSPFADVAQLHDSQQPGLNGIPFLAPWANRVAGAGFWANGNHYRFNPEIDSVHIGANGVAIHGMLSSSSLWEVVKLGADKKGAYVTSRLQFWRYPNLMANWPIAHEYEMTYTLEEGMLQVNTAVTNRSAVPMPLALGFHPYFQIPDVARASQTIHIGAREHVETDSQLIATGALRQNRLPEQISLENQTFDDGFTDLIRDSLGHALFSVQAANQKIEVIYGPNYQVGLVYAPPGENFVCFEPMTAITNGLNLAHDGKYSQLQTVAAGATWTESFWIRFSGF